MLERLENGEVGVSNVDQSERTAVARLLQLAGVARLFRSGDGRLFARVLVENRSEVHALKSGAFRDWLIGAHFRECGALPPDGAVRRVIGALEAFSRFEGGAPSIFIRVAGSGKSDGAATYIDLGDTSGRAVEIVGGGWSIVDQPMVDFRRPEGLEPLPVPSREGSIELLRPYVNLTERDFRLLVVWMAAALRPVGPYPILAIYGEQNSAKSTLVKIVRRLIDPQHAPVLLVPGSTRDMMVTAVNGWLLAYDNISQIPAWLSDGLCVLSTGGAIAGRALFSNDERVVIHAQRPVILSGIEEFVRRGDLSDRCVFLNLPPIALTSSARRTRFGGRSTKTTRGYSAPCSMRSLGGCASFLRSSRRGCHAWRTSPRLPRRSAVRWDGGRGPCLQTTMRIARARPRRRSRTRTRHRDSRDSSRSRCGHELDRYRDRSARGAQRTGGQEGGIVGRMAQIAGMADE